MFLFSAVLLLASCDDTEPISVIPELEFVSMSPNPVIQLTDEVEIVISYRDGDGDLGENSPDVENLFVTDLRNDVVYKYRVQQLAPSDASVAIQGELSINLNSVILVDAAQLEEQATYEIYMEDRAGNRSNTISTEALLIQQ